MNDPYADQIAKRAGPLREHARALRQRMQKYLQRKETSKKKSLVHTPLADYVTTMGEVGEFVADLQERQGRGELAPALTLAKEVALRLDDILCNTLKVHAKRLNEELCTMKTHADCIVDMLHEAIRCRGNPAQNCTELVLAALAKYGSVDGQAQKARLVNVSKDCRALLSVVDYDEDAAKIAQRVWCALAEVLVKPLPMWVRRFVLDAKWHAYGFRSPAQLALAEMEQEEAQTQTCAKRPRSEHMAAASAKKREKTAHH